MGSLWQGVWSKRVVLYLYVGILAIGTTLLGIHVSGNEEKPLAVGLDLAGGASLLYTIDTSVIPPKGVVVDRVNGLKKVIERRVNSLGVSEASVYTVRSSALTGLPQHYRLGIDLPGVTDISEAIRQIGKTPFLEFKLYDEASRTYKDIPVTGGNVVGAEVQFLPGPGGALSNEPAVLLTFDSEGRKNFATVTRDNVGSVLGIFLDGVPISTPQIREAIPGGTTQISGAFDLQGAKDLAANLNDGALPLPIVLSETRTVNPTLGAETLSLSIKAGFIAILLIVLFLIFVYRAVGLLTAIALSAYLVIMIALFKVIPVVLTAAGLAGFIMSVGFAVDANVLIFERMREELRKGSSFTDAVERGFVRAWNSIRDANLSSIIIALLLFWFGTSIVKGFAFTFALGIIVSMLSAYWISRLLLRLLARHLPKVVNKWIATQ